MDVTTQRHIICSKSPFVVGDFVAIHLSQMDFEREIFKNAKSTVRCGPAVGPALEKRNVGCSGTEGLII